MNVIRTKIYYLGLIHEMLNIILMMHFSYVEKYFNAQIIHIVQMDINYKQHKSDRELQDLKGIRYVTNQEEYDLMKQKIINDKATSKRAN